MRITDQQRSIICNTVAETFGAEAGVWLFGSRVDGTARGGDIDLYIEPAVGNAKELGPAQLRFLAALHKKLGERKIDMVIRRAGSEASLPIYQIAQQTGVKLS